MYIFLDASILLAKVVFSRFTDSFALRRKVLAPRRRTQIGFACPALPTRHDLSIKLLGSIQNLNPDNDYCLCSLVAYLENRL